MLTKLKVRNFKRFGNVEIELGNPVVFIGPNNSGKTSALQALALWEIGLRRWNEKRTGKATPEKRPGVTINRRDLIALPVPDANLLWRNLHVRDIRKANGRQETKTSASISLLRVLLKEKPGPVALSSIMRTRNPSTVGLSGCPRTRTQRGCRYRPRQRLCALHFSRRCQVWLPTRRGLTRARSTFEWAKDGPQRFFEICAIESSIRIRTNGSSNGRRSSIGSGPCSAWNLMNRGT